ncbi:MAG: hypothetical protein ACKOX6_09910 [Bdellovibrio sp.]
MKSLSVLPLLFVILTACQEAPQLNSNQPATPEDLPPRTVTAEAPSGTVILQMISDEEVNIPANVHINIEKANTAGDNLQISRLPSKYAEMLFTTPSGVISFGCETAEPPTELPLKIKAERVILCGKHVIPAGEFEIHATTLELHDVHLTTTGPASLTKYSSVTVFTANLELFGSNQIELVGKTFGHLREQAPPMTLTLLNSVAHGSIEIVSRKNVTTWNY